MTADHLVGAADQRQRHSMPSALAVLMLMIRCILAWIMHYAALFWMSGELTRADIPSGEIGARQLVMQRVRG
jgi:hypothetical protein